jgi:DNA-directed RNA polymerase specialized sigma24 family protein
MSKMSELAYDIQELYIDGFNSRAIAEELGCPLEIVTSALAEMNVEDVAEKPHEEYSPYYGA